MDAVEAFDRSITEGLYNLCNEYGREIDNKKVVIRTMDKIIHRQQKLIIKLEKEIMLCVK